MHCNWCKSIHCGGHENGREAMPDKCETTQPMATCKFTAVIEREDDGFVALCPELDVASQGGTVSEARANLREAIELLLETASPEELRLRLAGEVYVTQIEVAIA